MMNACPWTLPSSRGNREIDVYVRSCARLLVCVFVCMCVRMCVCDSFSLFNSLSLSLSFSVCLFILVCFYLFFPLSLVFSLLFSQSVYLCVCVSVSLRSCVCASVYSCITCLSNSIHKLDETSSSTPSTAIHTPCTCGSRLLRHRGRACCIHGAHWHCPKEHSRAHGPLG